MLNTGLSPWPSYTEEEAKAVSDVVLSNRVNYWTGNECREFEKEFARWSGAEYAVALANGTLALDVALQALGVGAGDEVIVTPRSFIASVSCVVNAGAVPVFADVEPESGNLSARTIREKLTSKTKAIICVHLAGWPCDMEPIMELAEETGIKVIEDCAQAHGARYKGRSVGSLGDVGAWSFCQDKIMTTGGEGGMVTTNDKSLWEKMWAFKDHGKSWDAVYEREHPAGFRWLHDSFGTNWRMLEVQAAFGRIQLRRMDAWTEMRRRNAALFAEVCLRYSCVRLPEFYGEKASPFVDAEGETRHAHYKFYAYVCPERLADGWSRDRMIDELGILGVPCYQGSCSEIYRERAFMETGWVPEERLPVAKRLGEQSLMFLVHPSLREEEMIFCCEKLEEVLKCASL